jgi:hypothetical protein
VKGMGKMLVMYRNKPWFKSRYLHNRGTFFVIVQTCWVEKGRHVWSSGVIHLRRPSFYPLARVGRDAIMVRNWSLDPSCRSSSMTRARIGKIST